METDFRAAAERIEANPLGRLMYDDPELFHSNLININSGSKRSQRTQNAGIPWILGSSAW